MLRRVFLLLVDLELEVRNFDHPRPLDMGNLVNERHCDHGAAELQLVSALRTELQTVGIGLDCAIGAVKHRHDVIGFRGIRDRRRRRGGLCSVALYSSSRSFFSASRRAGSRGGSCRCIRRPGWER